jgi:hypothetical protein
MSKSRDYAMRHQRSRLIRAAASHKADVIHAEALGIEWVEAQALADGQPSKLKRFSINAYSGGLLRVSRYDTPVVIDLAGMSADPPVPTLMDHDSTMVVGHCDEVDKRESLLRLSGIASGVGECVDNMLAMAANGFPWRASVGAMPTQLEFVGDGVVTKVNGKSFKGPLYVARKSELKEVSFVAVAADNRTSVKVAATAAQQKEISMEFQQWIEAMGLVFAELRDDQKAKLQAKYDAEAKAATDKAAIEAAAKGVKSEPAAKDDPPPVQVPKFDLPTITAAYALHESQIEAKAAEFATKVDAAKLIEIKASAVQTAAIAKGKAIVEQWAPPRLEAEYIKAQALYEVALIQAERPKLPAIHASMRDFAPQVIEAAFARACGLQQMEKHYAPQILEGADRFKNLGLKETLLIHARQNGYSGREYVGNDNLREVIQAAFSTHTITTLLTTTGNKLLVEGFNVVPQSWRMVAGTRTVTDFKAVTAFRMNASLEYEEVGPAGLIPHGTVSQESYTMQAKTYGKMLALTRQDIINDDLGAFNDLRNRFAMGAAIKLNKVFWTLWINNSAFFTAARANLVTSSALGDAGLATAVAAFRNMAGPDGNLMALEPAVLLVPSTLEATARKFYVSQEIRDTTASTRLPVANIYYNRFRPIIVPELETAAYTGYSASTWYLLADPAVLATALMCFLDGQQSPTIESTDADFNTLGIQMRAYHDFGAAMSEYRAGVKATA